MEFLLHASPNGSNGNMCFASACRLSCDISNAGDVIGAVAATSPNLMQLELSCFNSIAANNMSDALRDDLLQLPSSACLVLLLLLLWCVRRSCDI
jgi:hypothetical protein